MKILRVFPDRTSYTPNDDMVVIGSPPLDIFIPPHDEVHISCIFSWDKKYCRELQLQWQERTDKPVRLGGPAFGSPATDFSPGLYIKNGITFTSRGCNNKCSWCMVPVVEGKLKELPICEGNIIQDNNFLQTNKEHQQKVFEMLKTQKAVCFKGGLQTDLINYDFIENLNSNYYTRGNKKVSRIAELWLACDTDSAMSRFKAAMDKLKKTGFTRDKIKCYALIGDDMDKNEARCREIYNAGAMPFAQLYQPIGAERKIEYSDDWKKFHRMWSRAPATKAHMEKGTRYQDFKT